METRKYQAAEKKRCNSHNCAQAVVCSYCDLVGLSEQTALDIAGAYGTGMGNMEGTCGALVGAGMIIGLATQDRHLSRGRMKGLMTKFEERNGATQCKQLKGIGTGKPLRDCPDCIADASEFLEEELGLRQSQPVAAIENPKEDASDSPGIFDGFIKYDPLLHKPNMILDEAGNYIVVLREGSRLPDSGMVPVMTQYDGHDVIYTGNSSKSLRNRIGHDHFKGHSSFSTFRISLGCLMGFRLIPRDRVPDGKHFRFSSDDEAALSEWMRDNLIFYFRPSQFSDVFETRLIDALNPPLNLDKNDSPVNAGFRDSLKALRNNRP